MKHLQFNLPSFKFLHTAEWINSSIWFIHGTLIGITTLGQNEPGSNGNEGLLLILQSSRTGESPSNSLV